MNRASARVVVVGAGAAGLAAATALARSGFSVRVFDRRLPDSVVSNAATDPRVYALSAQAVDFLAELEAWGRLPDARACRYTGMAVWRDAPKQALQFPPPAPGAALGWIVEHGALQSALAAAAVAAGVVLTAAEVRRADVEDEEAPARVVLADGSELQADLLIVADGADSPLRAQLGVALMERDYPQLALVAHLGCERPHAGVARQRFLPDSTLALLPLADGRVSLVWSVAPEAARELLALDDAAFLTRLTAASQGVLGALGPTITARLSFPLRAKLASSPIRGRAVLLGDAAHVVHPLAGQGLNLGLADAAALASTLAAARDAGRGWWRPRTLEAYARQREADVREMLLLTDGLQRAMNGAPERLSQMLGKGLGWLDRIGPAKHWLAARASGG